MSCHEKSCFTQWKPASLIKPKVAVGHFRAPPQEGLHTVVGRGHEVVRADTTGSDEAGFGVGLGGSGVIGLRRASRSRPASSAVAEGVLPGRIRRLDGSGLPAPLQHRRVVGGGAAVTSGRGVLVGVGVAADCAGAHDASTGPRHTTATISSQGHSFKIEIRREVMTVWVSNLVHRPLGTPERIGGRLVSHLGMPLTMP